MEGLMEEMINNLVMAAIIVIAFFAMVYTQADLTTVYQKYYTKDFGMIIEQLHSVPGEVQLTYKDLNAQEHFLFNITQRAVFSKRSAKDKRSFRSQFGVVTSKTEPLVVQPALLVDPLIVDFSKQKEKIATTKQPLPFCAMAAKSVSAGDTRLIVEGELEKQLEKSRFNSLLKNVHATKTINIKIEEGANLALRWNGNAQLALKLNCLLTEELEGRFSTYVGSSRSFTTPRATIEMTVIVPKDILTKRKQQVAAAIIVALDNFIGGTP